MPSQIQRDLATWSKTKPETDNEILKVCYRIYLCIVSILTPECAPTEKGAGRQASGISFEARVSRAQLAPPRVPAKSRTSPSKPALKPSYSHVVKQGLKTLTRDPGKTHMMKSHAPPVSRASRVTTCDPGKQESRVTTCDPGKPGDLPRDWSSARPRDVMRFRCATCPLIGTWKTVGQSTVTRLTIVTHAQSAVNVAQH